VGGWSPNGINIVLDEGARQAVDIADIADNEFIDRGTKRDTSYKLRLSAAELEALHATARDAGVELSTLFRELPRFVAQYQKAKGSIAEILDKEHRDRIRKAAAKL
jgi:predicted DNA binding CopG/RHH family protein